jgi:DNA-binding MarR family transcriptional regulator
MSPPRRRESETPKKVVAADDFTKSEFASDKKKGQKGKFVPDWVIPLVETKAELLVLSQLAYWFAISSRTGERRAKVHSEGYYWVYKTYAKLAREVGLTKGQVRGAVRKLCEKGLLVKLESSGKAKGARRFRIDPGCVAQLSAAKTTTDSLDDADDED